MKKIKTKFRDLKITPVLHLSRSLYAECFSIFASQYKGVLNDISYDLVKDYTEIALMKDGNYLVGFLQFIDFIKLSKSQNLHLLDHVFHGQMRKTNLKEIEIAWIHPRYRGNGLMTEFYRYAISNMNCTQIIIDEWRVIDRVNYWRDIGFTKFFLNPPDRPRLTLHIDSNDDRLLELTTENIYMSFYQFGISAFIPRNNVRYGKTSTKTDGIPDSFQKNYLGMF